MTRYRYNAEIAARINEYLNDEDWKFSFDEEGAMFKFGLRLRGKLSKLNYIVDVKQKEFVVYGILPIASDEDDPEMMAAVSEYVNRANYGLKNGCFELDFDDGEIRYKSYVDCEGQLPSRDVINNSILCIAAMVERYGKGFGEVIFCGVSAKDALEKCEHPVHRSAGSDGVDAAEDLFGNGEGGEE